MVLQQVGSLFENNPVCAGVLHQVLRVEFLLRTDSGYPKDTEVTLFTLANPENSLR